uniref:Parathyroid hormone 2 receptor n=1 Tax=Oncorhynchus kisutch TaxID=8019 RepID=A0A8C7IF81_ONCKI
MQRCPPIIFKMNTILLSNFAKFLLCWNAVYLHVYAQVHPEVGLTAQEQMYLLYDVKVECHQNISTHNPADDLCPPGWDGLICWPQGSTGVLTKVPCPSYIYDFNHQGHAYRKCDVNGSWVSVEGLNRTWSNYSDCLRFLLPGQEEEKQDFFDRLYVMYTIGYALSFISLLGAIVIIGYFRRLHCTRNYIHMHMFMSFVLRAVSIFVKDKVVHTNGGLQEFDTALMDNYKTISAKPLDKSQFVSLLSSSPPGLLSGQRWQTHGILCVHYLLLLQCRGPGRDQEDLDPLEPGGRREGTGGMCQLPVRSQPDLYQSAAATGRDLGHRLPILQPRVPQQPSQAQRQHPHHLARLRVQQL